MNRETVGYLAVLLIIAIVLVWGAAAYLTQPRRFVDCWTPSNMLVPYGWPSDKPYINTETPPPQCR